MQPFLIVSLRLSGRLLNTIKVLSSCSNLASRTLILFDSHVMCDLAALFSSLFKSTRSIFYIFLQLSFFLLINQIFNLITVKVMGHFCVPNFCRCKLFHPVFFLLFWHLWQLSRFVSCYGPSDHVSDVWFNQLFVKGSI